MLRKTRIPITLALLVCIFNTHLAASSKPASISFLKYCERGEMSLNNNWLLIPSYTKPPLGDLDGIEDIVGASKITSLTCQENEVTSVPDGIGALVALTDFDLRSNQIATVSAHLGKLTELVHLNLGQNQLRQFPEIATLLKLKALYLQDNQIPRVPSIALQQLELIYIQNNQITDLHPSIGELRRLRELYCWNNPIPFTEKELHRRLKLRPGVILVFKSTMQEMAEAQLYESIRMAKETEAQKAFKSIITGKVRGPNQQKIDVTKIRDIKMFDEYGNEIGGNNNLLHAVIVAMNNKRREINNDEDFTAVGKRKRIAVAHESLSKIFGYFVQFGGPATEIMLKTRNTQGDDVITAALATLNSLNREAMNEPIPILQYLFQKPPAERFTIMTREFASSDPTEEKDKHELIAQRQRLESQPSSVPQPGPAQSARTTQKRTVSHRSENAKKSRITRKENATEENDSDAVVQLAQPTKEAESLSDLD